MSEQEQIQILTVDDDAAFVDMLGDILEHEDEWLSVVTATSGSEGLRLLSEEEFDCVISDYEMPGMNGLAFFHAVRQRWDEIPFIMFTGRGEEEIVHKAISAGVTGYLQKKSGTDQYSTLVDLVRESVS